MILKRPNKETLLALGLLVVVAALTYLPLVSQLGYYHDDWFTAASKVGGVSLGNMHFGDRPLMGRLYEITYAFLGDAPVGWHLLAFAARLTGILAAFVLFRIVWPNQRVLTTAMALLFAVYPGFLLQPNANNYSNHLIALALAVISLALTALALTTRRWWLRWPLAIAAAGLMYYYNRIYETFIGLEGLRFALIVFLLYRNEGRRKANLFFHTLLNGLPYLLSAGYVLYWRLFIFQSSRSGTDVGLLVSQYRANPLDMSLRLVFETGKDVLEAVFFAWIVPAYRLFSAASNIDLLVALLIAGLCVFLVWGYVRRAGLQSEPVESAPSRSVLLVGGIAVVISLLPGILANRDVRFVYNLDRYTLQSIPAVAILLSGVMYAWIKPALRLPALLTFLALGVMAQYTNAAEYRDIWKLQRELWWQVTWRAPQIERETVLTVMLPEGYRASEDFEVWAPANLIYYPQAGDMIGITAQVLNPDTFDDYVRGEGVMRSFRQIPYIRRMNKVLLLSVPTVQSCVHFIDGSRPEVSSADNFLVRQAAQFSRIDQVDPNGVEVTPPVAVFGAEPEHGWCYYYQKAGLARQKGEWEEVARLGDEAMEKDFSPAVALEWLPFYEAYMQTGRLEKAARLEGYLKADENAFTSFCSQWTARTGIEQPGSPVSLLCRQDQP